MKALRLVTASAASLVLLVGCSSGNPDDSDTAPIPSGHATASTSPETTQTSAADEEAVRSEVDPVATGQMDVTSDKGYTYHIAWSDLSVTADLDPTKGVPGTAHLVVKLSGSVRVQNTTDGKQSPPVLVRMNPLYPESYPEFAAARVAENVPTYTGDFAGGLQSLVPFSGMGVVCPVQNNVMTDQDWKWLEPGQRSTCPYVQLSPYGVAEAFTLVVPSDQASTIKAQVTAPSGWGAMVGAVGLGIDSFDEQECYASLSGSYNFQVCLDGVSDSLR